MNKEAREKRDLAIVKDWANGVSKAQLGAKHSITYQRVTQIIRERGHDASGRRDQRGHRCRVEQRLKLADLWEARILQTYEETRSEAEVARKLGLSLALVRLVTGRNPIPHATKFGTVKTRGVVAFTKSHLTATLRQAARDNHISLKTYRAWREQHGGPHYLTYRNHFGTFRLAVEAAGLHYLDGRGDGALWRGKAEAIWLVTQLIGKIPTTKQYEEVRRQDPSLPPLYTFMRKGTSWLAHVSEAEELMRRERTNG